MARGAYGFGIARTLQPVKSRARLAGLCELMTRDLGVVFLPQHADSYHELVRDFDRGATAVAWMPPLPCIEVEKRQSGASVVLPVRSGSMTYFSALVACRTRGPRTLADVKKLKVAWVDPESSSGYLVPRLHLQAHGRSLRAMFDDEIMAGSHEAVLDAVEGGRADVGATYCASKAPRWMRSNGVQRPLEALTVTGPIPNDAILVSPKLPADVRSQITRWFVSLQEDRARQLSAELLNATEFRVASFGHFGPLRQLIAATSSAS